MAKQINVAIRMRVSGDGLDQTNVFQSLNSNGPQSLELITGAGFNGPWAQSTFGDGIMLGAVVVPPNSTSGIPAASGIAKTIKGSGGDVGLSLDPASVFAATIPSGLGGFGITYATPEELLIIFF